MAYVELFMKLLSKTRRDYAPPVVEYDTVNLLRQFTCRSLYTPREWEWAFEQAGYTGDYSYIVFE